MNIHIYSFLLINFLGKHPFCEESGNINIIKWMDANYKKIETDKFPNKLLELCYSMLNKVYIFVI
jgi:hypothetical protein